MDIPGWRIGLDGSVARIGSRGGIALSWSVPGPSGRLIELLDGYRDREERRRANGARQALLAPWSNRIHQSRYHWDGRDFDLGPDADGVREGLHGLALDAGFELVEQTDSALTLRTTVEHPEYPGVLRVSAKYELGHTTSAEGDDEWSLHLTLSARNIGEVDAPIGLGWHPYLRWFSGSEGARVEFPAAWQVLTDDAQIPLPQTAAFEAVEGGRVVIETPANLDTAWTGLSARGGIAALSVEHPGGGRTTLETDVRLNEAESVVPGVFEGQPGIGVFHIFTGEGLADRPGRSMAVEYCQFLTDAYNRPDLSDALRVSPGATRTMRVRLVHTF